MQGLIHYNVMREMTEAHTVELLRDANVRNLRKSHSPAEWRDRLGLGLIRAGLRLVTRNLEVRVQPTRQIA